MKNRKNIFRYLSYILLAFNGLVILLLLLSVLAWWVSPAKTTLFAYLGLGFPFIFCANLLFVALWVIFFKWKFALVAFIPLLICICPILTYFPVNIGDKSKEYTEGSIKLLSYNVRAFNWFKEKNLKDNEIVQYIKDNNPDIICLQEFLSLEKNNKLNLKSIKRALENYPYHSLTILESSYKRRNINYGLICFSKYPIVETKQIPLETRDIAGSVLYKIKVEDKIISVINNHLESNRLTSGDRKLYQSLFTDGSRQVLDSAAHTIRQRLGSAYQKRSFQADLISEWIKNEEPDRMIVCGDFNDTPISYTYHKIKGDLKDSYAETGFGSGITYNENFFWFRIDYIMHSANIKSWSCTVDKVKYSDHYPVWAYLKIN